MEALRLLVGRRAELTPARIQCVNRVHRLLPNWFRDSPSGGITTAQARRILATVKPRDVAGKTRRRLAAEQVADLVVIEKKVKALTRELKEMVLATGSRLMVLKPRSDRRRHRTVDQAPLLGTTAESDHWNDRARHAAV